MRTPPEWLEYCRQNISAGYTPEGDKGLVYAMGKILANILHDHLPWKAGDTVLDVGCGNGRLAFGLLDSGVNYHGIEIIRPCVEFCQKAFLDYPDFHFYHLDLRNDHYWAIGAEKAEQAVYPLPDHCVDYVVAHSLFSHTGTIAAAQRNLNEMRRVMKEGALLCSTFFLAPPKPAPDESEAVTVYARSDFERMVSRFVILEEFSMPTNRQIAFTMRKTDA